MIDLFLRTDTPEAIAETCTFLWGEDGWITSGDGWVFDPIGAIVTEHGTYDDDGNEIASPVIDGRFHANLRCTEAVAKLVPETVRVHPTSPMRVWA